MKVELKQAESYEDEGAVIKAVSVTDDIKNAFIFI